MGPIRAATALLLLCALVPPAAGGVPFDPSVSCVSSVSTEPVPPPPPRAGCAFSRSGPETQPVDSRALCGAWASGDVVVPQAVCGTFRVRLLEPICGHETPSSQNGPGAYHCDLEYLTDYTFAGFGCLHLLSNLPSSQGDASGECGAGVVRREALLGNDVFSGIPPEGRDFTFVATACVSYLHGLPGRWSEPDASSRCMTWTVGTVHLPGPPA